MSRNLKNISDKEREFLFNELFFSTTDLNGKITSWNEVFERISGFSDQELMDKPHSLIRHPDMPRGVFYLLWDKIKKGEIVTAYVKNLAKDGRFYWVYALVLPVPNGYLSIRLKPSSKVFELTKQVYKDLLSFEEALIDAGNTKAVVAEQSMRKLFEKLKELGLPDYFSFMKLTFPLEIMAREDYLKEQFEQRGDKKIDGLRNVSASVSSASIEKLETNLNKIFIDLTKSLDLSKNIDLKFKETQELASEIKRGALNATIEASRLGNSGNALFVLANYLDFNTAKTIQELVKAQDTSQKSLSEVTDILFIVCVAKLQTEALSSFLAEAELNKESAIKMSVNRLEILQNCFKQGIADMAKRYRGLEEAFSKVLLLLEDIRLLFVSLKVAHVSAKAEASRIVGAARFGTTFDEVNSVVDATKDNLDQVTQDIVSYISTLRIRESSCKYVIQNISSVVTS